MSLRETLLTCVLLVGCDSAPTPASAPAHHGKPTAAVDVRLDTTALGGGDYEVTLTATATAAATALDLQLDGARLAAGAVAAGEARTMTTRVHVGTGRGREVFAAAAVGHRNVATSTWVGVPRVAPARATTIITLPDGNEVAEVRP